MSKEHVRVPDIVLRKEPAKYTVVLLGTNKCTICGRFWEWHGNEFVLGLADGGQVDYLEYDYLPGARTDRPPRAEDCPGCNPDAIKREIRAREYSGWKVQKT